MSTQRRVRIAKIMFAAAIAAFSFMTVNVLTSSPVPAAQETSVQCLCPNNWVCIPHRPQNICVVP